MKYFLTFLFVSALVIFDLRVNMIDRDMLNPIDRILWSVGLKQFALRNTMLRNGVIFNIDGLEVNQKKAEDLVNELIEIDPVLRTYEHSIILKQLDFILKNKSSNYRYFHENIKNPTYFSNLIYIVTELEKKDNRSSTENEMLVLAYLNLVKFDYFFLFKAKFILNEMKEKDLWALYYALDNKWIKAKDILNTLNQQKDGINFLFLSTIARKLKDPILEIDLLKKSLKQIALANFSISKLNEVFTNDLGNETELISILEQEYSQNNENFWLAFILADSSFRAKKYQNALSYLVGFENEKNPLFLKAQILKITIWVEEKKYLEAYELGSKLLEKNKVSFELKKQVGFAAIGMQKYAEGVKFLEEYTFAEPSDYQVQLTLFQNYFYHLNKFYQADQKLKECEELNPNDPLLQKIKNDFVLTKQRLNIK